VNTGEVTYIQIGDERLPGVFDAGQSDERRISAVQYVRFRFNDTQREAFATGATPSRLVINHPNYWHETLIIGAIQEELTKDFF
jgi:hypothetical protein